MCRLAPSADRRTGVAYPAARWQECNGTQGKKPGMSDQSTVTEIEAARAAMYALPEAGLDLLFRKALP